MQDAAAAFCTKHGLPDEVRGPLAAHIADNLARALLSPGDTPAGSSDGGGDDADVLDPSQEYAQLHRHQQQLQHQRQHPPEDQCAQEERDWSAGILRDSLFSDEGSFVAEPLPTAAALPAQGRQPYTAPPSPTKRAGGGGIGSRIRPDEGTAAGPVEQDPTEQAAAVTEEAEGECGL